MKKVLSILMAVVILSVILTPAVMPVSASVSVVGPKGMYTGYSEFQGDAARLGTGTWWYTPMWRCSSIDPTCVVFSPTGAWLMGLPYSYSGYIILLDEPDLNNITPSSGAVTYLNWAHTYLSAKFVVGNVSSSGGWWLDEFLNACEVYHQGTCPGNITWGIHAFVGETQGSVLTVMDALKSAHQLMGGSFWVTKFSDTSGNLVNDEKLTNTFKINPWIERWAYFVNRATENEPWYPAGWDVQLFDWAGIATPIGRWYTADNDQGRVQKGLAMAYPQFRSDYDYLEAGGENMWWHDWGAGAYADPDYVPMSWCGENPNLPQNYSGYVILFNEPDIYGQCNISVDVAAARFNTLHPLYPNVKWVVGNTYGPDWIRAFATYCASNSCPTVDVWGIHDYISTIHWVPRHWEVWSALIAELPGEYWVTEFGCISEDPDQVACDDLEISNWQNSDSITRWSIWTNRDCEVMEDPIPSWCPPWDDQLFDGIEDPGIPTDLGIFYSKD